MTKPEIQEPRSERYNPHAIEQKWQDAWQASGLYTFDPQAKGEKHYALTMFPYPSGNLHIGHWYANVAPDAHARWMRMRGYNVLFPMGFDSFGLPAENAAIKRGVNPRSWTYDNIAHMKGQFGRMGTMIDWTRSFATSDPEYYRWNQWFFTQFFRRGLAYKKGGLVNWCPKDQTVLANEQVVGGACERCGTPVERRNLSQWYLNITGYAERLLDFNGTDMPERVQLMQTNWIGKSVGAEVTFATPAGPETVFTTRPDTLMGATFMVLAPEHAKVAELTTDEQRAAVEAYVAAAGRKTDVERQQEGEKTGVFTGSFATHPVTGEQLPIWVADYVLVTYGTGSIMAVPAHDERDFAFAKKFELPIREVIRAEGDREGMGVDPAEPYTGEGVIVNSGEFDGLPGGKASIAEVIGRLEAQGIARAKTTYRLRDWLVGRQRYWGTPIPIIHCAKCGPQPVPESDLPVRLPDNVEFTPTGQSPLKLDTEWVQTTCPECGGPAERDTDTMDTFVDSSWYMYRYLSPDYDAGPFDPAHKGLMPVDLYTGGIEHAILHLLYSRFWTKVMHDMGLVEHDEPFHRVRNQGMVLGEDGEKMSKSRGNVVDPDDLVAEYGADTVRTYLMFIAPWELGGPWDTQGINGPAKWLGRVWTLFFGGQPEGPRENVTEADLRFAVHSTLKKVDGDFERMSFNTIVASLMELTNVLVKTGRSDLYGTPAWEEALHIFNLMLAPAVPHIAEEVWQGRGGAGSVHTQPWPQVDEAAAVRDTVTIGVQVTGKMRGQIDIAKAASQEDALAAAEANPEIAKHLQGKERVKVIYVPGRILNIVVK
ncbi:MAG: leucine--tRNA ligase [Deinococcus sp.]|nr:leucine--tRNA ligase [Deinococcus sp.]